MIKKRKLGKVVANYNGYRVRHCETKGGRLCIYQGKNKTGNETFPSAEEAIKYLKKVL